MSPEPHRTLSPYSQPAPSPSDEGTHRPPATRIDASEPSAGGNADEALRQVPSPAVDLIENTDELWVFIDLPGFQPDEIQLQADAQTLRVSASRPSEIEEGRAVLVHERTTDVERTVRLPVAVDTDEIDVIYEHGVCKMTIPKTENERFRDIEIRTPE